MTEQYNAFEGLNLSNARSEDETREQYKTRLRTNRKILKLYEKVGREQFQQMFPNGIYEALEKNAEEIIKSNNDDREKAVEQSKTSTEKLGEAK